MRETAYAKLNLALHVRARAPDGYHRIETLFAFCQDGDTLELEPSPAFRGRGQGEGLLFAPVKKTLTQPSPVKTGEGFERNGPRLTISGEFADGLSAGPDNLVLRAAAAFSDAFGAPAPPLALTKRLPVAAGIGGGSADAAAVLRLLARLHGVDLVDPRLLMIAAALGSDVPACLASTGARGEGRGERLVSAPVPAGAPVLLVNPCVLLATGPVFAGWDGRDRGPLGDWRAGRNDLEPSAVALVPVIADVLAFLRDQPGAELARMSGSGATCFALFADERARDEAAIAAPAAWWRLATRLRA